MIEAEWWEYDSVDEMADAVAGDIGFIVESAIDARNEALLALPGGETPKPIFARLVEAKLPWRRVTIIPGDERLVPMDSELSNVRTIAQSFLPVGARVIPITGDIADYKLAGNSADARLQDLHWPPDLVWLGMGGDGHTASIFNGPDMDDALNAPKARRAVGVMPEPLPAEAPVPRVTLTRAAILSARTILITIRGQEKRELLEQAAACGEGHALALNNLGVMYEQGLGVPVDLDRQQAYYAAAAELGEPQGQLNLGRFLLARGWLDEAMPYLRAAAAAGVAEARLQLRYIAEAKSGRPGGQHAGAPGVLQRLVSLFRR